MEGYNCRVSRRIAINFILTLDYGGDEFGKKLEWLVEKAERIITDPANWSAG